MKRLIDHILKPNRVSLTLYGAISIICLVAYVWWFSFYGYFFKTFYFIIGLLGLFFIGLLISFFVDKKFQWRLKYYFIISIIQLIVIWMGSNPIRTWQIDSSLENGEQIVTLLEKHKLKFGSYPLTLLELGKKYNLEIPTRSNIGTRYNYEVEEGQDYNLWFSSYYGYYASYSTTQKRWIVTDGY